MTGTRNHRTGVRLPQAPADTDREGSYRSLFRIATQEPSRAVTAAAIREIGLGGETAQIQLEDHFGSWWRWWSDAWATPEAFASGSPDNTARDNGRLTALYPSSRTSAKHLEPPADKNTAARHARIYAVLAPLLYRPPSERPDPDAFGDDKDDKLCADALRGLQRWVNDYLPVSDPARPARRSWIALEIPLARGFLQAANRRPQPGDEEWRAKMVELAENALKNSRYWFAQLNLVQALTLLSLPADPATPLPTRGHGSDPYGLVEYWLSIAGIGCVDVVHRVGHRTHPLVAEMGELARRALATRRPERYCWIDELTTTKQIGCVQQSESYPFRQWILDAAGWSGLDPRAQQLLGDVTLLLHLTSRGLLDENPTGSRGDGVDTWHIDELEEMLARSDRTDLPPCLVRDRGPLDVKRTIAAAGRSEPGSTCHDSCPFRLCPYPPRGRLPYQVELGEGFCRAVQQTGRTPRYARGMKRSAYVSFWEKMAERNRPSTSRKPGDRLRTVTDEPQSWL